MEQYLRFFIDHRQKNWPEWLALAEFAINNKVHLAMKISPFMINYRRIGADIRKNGKVEKAMEFVERIKKMQKEAGTALKKI